MDNLIWIVIVGLFCILGGLGIWSLFKRGVRQHRWKLGIKEAFRCFFTAVVIFWWVTLYFIVILTFVLIATFLDAHPLTGVVSNDFVSGMCASGIALTMILIMYKTMGWLPSELRYSPEEKAILKQEDIEFRNKHKRVNKVMLRLGG